MHEVVEVDKTAPLGEQVGHPRVDDDLAMARRLDWRFLLPNPTLHRVAYLGSGEESLTDGTSPTAALSLLI
jgi:hypothetical protein